MNENIKIIIIVLIASVIGGFVSGLVGNQSGTAVGGSTSSDWNVGGNLSVTGTSAFTGALTSTGALTVTGATDVGIFTQGGGCTASTTAVATETWSEAFMLASNCFTYSDAGTTAPAITITLPATSTMTTLLPNAGDTRQWFYDPSAYAAATTTTFAAGTGIILMEPDGQNVVIAGATSAATLECIRKANTDVVCTVDEVVDAD